jgi:hypothetical protein
LIQKLAMEKVESHRSEERIGTTYRLYPYGTILERRRQTGLQWVTRNRGGVTFVSPSAPSGGTVPLKPPPRDTVTSQATVSVSSKARGTVASEDTPLDKELVNRRQTSASPPSALISTTAAKLGVTFDDDAVRTLVRRCLDGDPKASYEEIAHFLDVKVRQLQRSKTVENWVGLLMASVPVFFQAPATELQRYREAKRAAEREGREAHQQLIAEARKILDDPNSTESDQAWARQVRGEWSGEIAGSG